MANNYGLMLAAGGAALIGFVFLSQGGAEEELKKVSKKGPEQLPPMNQEADDLNKQPDGTCHTEDGVAVLCRDVKESDLIIQGCVDWGYYEDGSVWCEDSDRERAPLLIREEPEPRNWYWGPIDWMTGVKRDDILERTDSAEDTKLYMYSGDPVITSIGTTSPAWFYVPYIPEPHLPDPNEPPAWG